MSAPACVSLWACVVMPQGLMTCTCDVCVPGLHVSWGLGVGDRWVFQFHWSVCVQGCLFCVITVPGYSPCVLCCYVCES